MDYLAQQVGDLVDDHIAARDVYEENILSYVEVYRNEDGGPVSVMAVETVRWSEFEVPAWQDATAEHIEAVRQAFKTFYGADDMSYTEDDDEAYLLVGWAVEVEPTCMLGAALYRILRREPEGPVGFHNCSNGAYGARRNVYRDVKEAVAAVGESVGV